MPSRDEPLRLHEVGSYGELKERPNPDGLVVRHSPPFEAMLPIIVQQAGRELSPEEIEAARAKAVAIVLTKEQAEKVAASAAKRAGRA